MEFQPLLNTEYYTATLRDLGVMNKESLDLPLKPMNVKFIKLTNHNANICVILYCLGGLPNTASHLVFKVALENIKIHVISLIGRG